MHFDYEHALRTKYQVLLSQQIRCVNMLRPTPHQRATKKHTELSRTAACSTTYYNPSRKNLPPRQVNPLTKKEIKFSEDYRKVPIVRMGGELFKDSPVIIDELIARLREAKVMSDEEHAVFCSSDAKKWRSGRTSSSRCCCFRT